MKHYFPHDMSDNELIENINSRQKLLSDHNIQLPYSQRKYSQNELNSWMVEADKRGLKYGKAAEYEV